MNPHTPTFALASKVAILGDQAPLTISEVAKLLNRSESTIHRLIAAGKLKKTKINRSSYVQLCHVKSLLSGDTTEGLA